MKSAPLHPMERRRLEALRRTRLLDSPATPEFDDAAKLAAFICGTPIALVSLVDEHRQWFKSKIGLEANETPRDIAFCAHAILGREVFVVPDARADERFLDNPLVTGDPHVTAYAGAPLVTAEGDTLGTLCVIDREKHDFTPEQLSALAVLARQVVAQIRVAEQTRELIARASEMSVVNELGELLQSCRTMDETTSVVALYMRRLFPFASGTVSVTNPSRDQVETRVAWGDGQDAGAFFGPDDCWSLRRGRVHRVDPEIGGLACRHVKARAGHAPTCIPMMADGETIGVLHVSEEASETSDARLQLMTICAERIGLALSNARLRDTLRAQSIRDPLTGLFNRRYLEESLERELRRCIRHGRPLSVMMFDVDHFKRFNDTFGHDGGDAVLQALGIELRRHVRVEDIVCRYGGEEFVVVLPESEVTPAAARAEKLCAAVKGVSLRHRGVQLGTISVSVGVSTLGANGQTTKTILAAADAALYQAKEAGRDCVVVAAPAADNAHEPGEQWSLREAG